MITYIDCLQVNNNNMLSILLFLLSFSIFIQSELQCQPPYQPLITGSYAINCCINTTGTCPNLTAGDYFASCNEIITFTGGPPGADYNCLVYCSGVFTNNGSFCSSCSCSTPVPTGVPTISPTIAPTNSPTITPTKAPTEAPTVTPTGAPTEAPTTASPTGAPTPPTNAPTEEPSNSPTEEPTSAPTPPTKSPTRSPTSAPTDTPPANYTVLIVLLSVFGAIMIIVVCIGIGYSIYTDRNRRTRQQSTNLSSYRYGNNINTPYKPIYKKEHYLHYW